ncbi:DUF3343 domain-containing protein [uncultured Cetobacterium sp.]|uniref:DUF3343 domain-containing protein n=1 Tax=uncultured Cetobacterium sp. TaxID=527638 RepID=UPI00262E1C67|nr:DUF3343 domain-containing protein [uncultured Cetobacterium sp.]
MKSENYLILTIDSTHLVMKVEKLLLDHSLDIRVIPLPGELKASCGLSIKGNIEDAKSILNILKSNEIKDNLYQFYSCEKTGFKKKFNAFIF